MIKHKLHNRMADWQTTAKNRSPVAIANPAHLRYFSIGWYYHVVAFSSKSTTTSPWRFLPHPYSTALQGTFAS